MEKEVNRNYKDTSFRSLFSEKNKENLLSLYNAIRHTHYADVNELEITTLDDVIYLSVKNDVSILIDGCLSLWEHQSTWNPNMPIRGFEYFAQLYDIYIKTHKLDIYSSKLLKLPTPQYIVFYNGEKDIPPITKLRLSDAFMDSSVHSEFEWTATVYNINLGKNDDSLDACPALKGYMTLIFRIRENLKYGMELKPSVRKAIAECKKDGILTDWLSKEGVETMLIEDFTLEKYQDLKAEEEKRDKQEIAFWKEKYYHEVSKNASRTKDANKSRLSKLMSKLFEKKIAKTFYDSKNDIY